MKSYTFGAGLNSEKEALVLVRAFERFLVHFHGTEFELMTDPKNLKVLFHTFFTLLDVLLTNQPDLFKNAGVSDIGLSDHCMVYGFLKETVKKHTADIITCRSFKNLDMEEFKKDLEEAVWFKQNVTEVDKLYDNWYCTVPQMIPNRK